MELFLIALGILAVLFVAWQAQTAWVWFVIGLAMIAGSAFVVWWANVSLQSPDLEAPFVVGAMGICTGLPLALLCFVMAVATIRPRPGRSEEPRDR